MRKNTLITVLSMALALTNIIPVMAMGNNEEITLESIEESTEESVEDVEENSTISINSLEDEVSGNNTDTEDVTFNLTATPVNKVSGKDMVKNKIGRTLTVQDNGSSVARFVPDNNFNVAYVDVDKDFGHLIKPVISVKSRKNIEDGYHLLGICYANIFCINMDDNDYDAYAHYGLNAIDLVKNRGVDVRYIPTKLVDYTDRRFITDADGNETEAFYGYFLDEQLEAKWKEAGSPTEENPNPYVDDESTISNNYINTSVKVGDYTITYPECITFTKSKKAMLDASDVTVSGPNGTFHPKKVTVKKATKTGQTTFKMKLDKSLDKEVRKILGKEKLPISIVAYNVTDNDAVVMKKNKKGKITKVTVNGIKLKKNEYQEGYHSRERSDGTKEEFEVINFSGRFNNYILKEKVTMQ